MTSNGDAAILRCPVAGGAIQPVVRGLANVIEVVVGSRRVYWLGNAGCGGWQCLPGGHVRSAPKRGGTFTQLWPYAAGDPMADVDGPLLLTLGQLLFSGNGRALSMSAGGGASAPLRSSSPVLTKGALPEPAVLHDGWIFWTRPPKCGGENCEKDGALLAHPLAGGRITPLATGLGCVSDLSADAGWLYFATDQRVMRVRKTGGAQEGVMHTKGAREVEVADGHVFFFAGDRLRHVIP